MAKYFSLGLVIAGSCVFWLGVNVFDGWVQRKVYPPIRLWWAQRRALLREKIASRKRRAATQKLGSTRRIGK